VLGTRPLNARSFGRPGLRGSVPSPERGRSVAAVDTHVAVSQNVDVRSGLLLFLVCATAACRPWPGDRHLNEELLRRPGLVRQESGTVTVEDFLGVSPRFSSDEGPLAGLRVSRCPEKLPPPFATVFRTLLPLDACVTHVDVAGSYLGNLPFIRVYAAPGATPRAIAAYLRSKERSVDNATDSEVRTVARDPEHLSIVLRGPRSGCMEMESTIEMALVGRPAGGTFVIASVGNEFPEITIGPPSVSRNSTIRREARKAAQLAP
jgi:hypothetical protein